MKRGRSWLLAAALCLLAAPAGGGQEKDIEKQIDGVLHVQNRGSPAQGIETWRLEELWRAGGEDDADVFFGLIGQVRSDQEGNIYLLDGQLSEVKVFSPAGKLVKTLSREGDGPGEVRGPNDMILLPDGRVGLTQTFPGRVVLVDQDGQPAGGFTLGAADPTQGGFTLVRGVRNGGGNLVFGVENATQGADQQSQNRTSLLASYDLEGVRGVVYHEYDWVFTFDRFKIDDDKFMDFAVRRFDVGPDGRVYTAADREHYAITVYRADGTVDRVIERDCSARRRTDEEKAELRELFEMAVRQIPIPTEIEIGETEPPISWLLNGVQVRQDGFLWVLTDAGTRDQPPGVMQTYDVFDPAGHFVRQVSMVCAGDPQEDSLFVVGQDRMLLVTGFMDALRAVLGGGATPEGEEQEEAAPVQVICYRIARAS